MTKTLESILGDESLRQELFPVTRNGVFLAHAGVAPLTGPAARAISEYAAAITQDQQECGNFWEVVRQTREQSARLIGAKPEEIALLGPTALGLNLVANGLTWSAGDEVVFYPDDYPSNVYPWSGLKSQGVRPVPLTPNRPGEITPELVFASLSSKTKLVALSSCHYLTGYRLDYQTIGEELHRRGILFCLDSIQSLGATPVNVKYLDFLSADSHKWLLGPLGAGIFYVKEEHFERLRPTLLGSWNVNSPGFIAQSEIAFPKNGQRYEPGSVNGLGIVGMNASLDLILEVGVEQIGPRLRRLHQVLAEGMKAKGWTVLSELFPEGNRTGIVTVTHPEEDLKAVVRRLTEAKMIVSMRWNREGKKFIRFSPHFYNTEAELKLVMEVI